MGGALACYRSQPSALLLLQALTKLSNAHETITASLSDQASPAPATTSSSTPPTPGEQN
jgi:hypothetical protein